MKGSYPYLRGDGVPVASPLFQGEGGGAIPTSPLQFSIQATTDITLVQQLVHLWHSRLPVFDANSAVISPCIGYLAEFDGCYWATAWWSAPVARLLNGRNWIELRRMAIGPQAPRNTASRMIRMMLKDIRSRFPEVINAISYQDCDVHTGTIYKASGWQCTTVNKDGSWDRPNRFRKAAQSDSPKQRWEYPL